MKSDLYPLATIIAYGPDNQMAKKLVVSIFKKPSSKVPDVRNKWVLPDGNIRLDPAIKQEVAGFIKHHHAAQTIGHDRIHGCPHEEGVDYPTGGVCPQCPFWEKVDRFTYEPKSPGLELSAQQILAGMSIEQETPPLKSLAAAELNKELVLEPLLQTVEWVISDPQNVPSAPGILFGYATCLLAKWRETRAFPLFLRWFSLPGEGPYDVGGDIVTQHGARFLASVCGGDVEPIKRLILDREADEFCRAAAIESLAVLAAWGELPREQVLDYFLFLAREGLEREASELWGYFAATCADFEAVTVFPELRTAFDQGLINDGIIAPEELDEVENAERGREFRRFQQHHPPITDVAREIGWWSDFELQPGPFPEATDDPDDLDPIAEPSFAPPKPYVAPPKIGRNEPCPCGSGKKYKKCCGK